VKRCLFVAIVAAAVCAAIPGASAAAPPVLGSAPFNQSTKVLSVTWSLPPGVESRVLEANTNPALDSEGYFLFGPNDGYYGPNIIFELPDSAATSWLHSYPDLPPGHYYVHVAGYDTTCTSCPIREWTTLGAFDVSPPPPHPTPGAKNVFAPDCVGRPHFRPRSIIVACGDGNLQLLRLRWSRWTSSVATGGGVYHWNDCIPQCYRGHFHSRAGARVEVYRVTRCRSKGFLQFTRMRVTPPRSLPRFKPFTQRLSCTFR
jgi:hypothetical protein